MHACPFFPTPLNSPSTLLWDREEMFSSSAPVTEGVNRYLLKIANLLDIFPVFVKHDDLVDAEHDTGPGDLPGQVRTKLGGLSVVQDGTRQGHAHRVRPT